MKKNYPGLFIITLFFLFTGSLISCKKDDIDKPSQPVQLSDADSLKFLMYRTMQVSYVDGGRDSVFDLPTYYWYNQVPAIDPLSATYGSADELLDKMISFPVNPASGNRFDRFSFIDQGQLSDEIQGGVAGDLGMQVTFAYDANNNIILVVLFTDKNSPSGKLGVTRGWQITGINGENNVQYDGGNGSNVNRIINAVYNDAQATFTFKKPDGSAVTHSLAKSVYQINPILFDTVFTTGGKKVGYFVFNTFSNVYNNGAPTFTKQEIDRVFAKFSAAAITSLIVDFRYNGGGSVNTAEYLSGLIAPASVTGKEMYRYVYNDKLTARAGEIGLQEKIVFEKGGNLSLNNVFFIGSDNTASASELTLNNLKPYMDVKLVGDTTYGKPVGFFTFTLNKYDAQGKEKFLADLYAINFETKNAAGQGGYYDGIIPDALANDYVGIAWGDSGDDHLAKIFSYLNTGSYGNKVSGFGPEKNKSLRIPITTTLQPMRFNGMIDYRVSGQLKDLK